MGKATDEGESQIPLRFLRPEILYREAAVQTREGLQAMNWGRVIGFGLAVASFAASIGYIVVHDWRRAIYFALCGAINVTVVY